VSADLPISICCYYFLTCYRILIASIVVMAFTHYDKKQYRATSLKLNTSFSLFPKVST